MPDRPVTVQGDPAATLAAIDEAHARSLIRGLLAEPASHRGVEGRALRGRRSHHRAPWGDQTPCAFHAGPQGLSMRACRDGPDNARGPQKSREGPASFAASQRASLAFQASAGSSVYCDRTENLGKKDKKKKTDGGPKPAMVINFNPGLSSDRFPHGNKGEIIA